MINDVKSAVESCFSCYLLVAGVLSSILTWVSKDTENKKPFFASALPNSILNGVFGTTFTMIIHFIYPNAEIMFLMLISATSGSLGRHVLFTTLSKLYLTKRK